MIRNSYRLRFIHCFIGAMTFFNRTKVDKGMNSTTDALELTDAMRQGSVVLVSLKLEKLMV